MPILANRPRSQNVGKDQLLNSFRQEDHESIKKPHKDAPARSIGVQKIGPVRSIHHDLGAITGMAGRRR